MKTAGYQFMVFAGDGLNSSPGVQAPSRGGQSRPHSCRSMRSRFGVLPSARFRFQSSIPIKLVPVVVRSFACDATCAPPSVASRRRVRSSSFLDFAKPIAGRSAPREHREQCAPSSLDITPCAIAGVLSADVTFAIALLSAFMAGWCQTHEFADLTSAAKASGLTNLGPINHGRQQPNARLLPQFFDDWFVSGLIGQFLQRLLDLINFSL